MLEEIANNLIVEFPGGKIEVKPWDWILGGIIIGGCLYTLHEVSKRVKKVEVSGKSVTVEFKDDSSLKSIDNQTCNN